MKRVRAFHTSMHRWLTFLAFLLGARGGSLVLGCINPTISRNIFFLLEEQHQTMQRVAMNHRLFGHSMESLDRSPFRYLTPPLPSQPVNKLCQNGCVLSDQVDGHFSTGFSHPVIKQPRPTKTTSLICMTINNYSVAKAWVITKVNKCY